MWIESPDPTKSGAGPQQSNARNARHCCGPEHQESTNRPNAGWR
jgi:hypothetical protein